MVPEPQRWFWQDLAASTGGIVTPGNVITAAGLALVGSGLKDVYQGERIRGLVKVAAGRLLHSHYYEEIADLSETNSPRSEAIAAGVDKVELVATIGVLVAALANGRGQDAAVPVSAPQTFETSG